MRNLIGVRDDSRGRGTARSTHGSGAKQTAINLARGQTKAPRRTRENVVAELVGVRIRPIQVRVEGFGEGAASFTWKPEQQRA